MNKHYDTFLVYTTREGGRFAWKEISEKEWEGIKESGCHFNGEYGTGSLAYAAFVEVKEDKDFILERIVQDSSLPDSKE